MSSSDIKTALHNYHIKLAANKTLLKHCDGPAEGVTAPATTSHDEHESETSVPVVLSPTNSMGCEPHGDRWHCDGPATILANSSGSIEHRLRATTLPTPPPALLPRLVLFQGAASALYSIDRVKVVGIVAGVGLQVVT